MASHSRKSLPSNSSLPPAGITYYTDQYVDNNKPLVIPTAGLTSSELNPIRTRMKKGQGFDWFKTMEAARKGKKPCPNQERTVDPKFTCKFDPYYCDPVQTIPIPLEGDRYPYRYCSAGPSSCGRTRKELDLKRCQMRLMSASEGLETQKSHRGLFPANVREVNGFQTTAIQAALQMFNAPNPIQDTHLTNVRKPISMPKSICEPSLAPFVAHSNFDRYVIETLHPKWTSDPLYTRRLNFGKKSLNKEEMDNWDEEWFHVKKEAQERKNRKMKKFHATISGAKNHSYFSI